MTCKMDRQPSSKKQTPSDAGRKRPHRGKGHRKRLREKFLASGLGGFHDYEVIELLLTLATPRKDCKPAAKAALKRFKNLQGVFEASAGICAASKASGRRISSVSV